MQSNALFSPCRTYRYDLWRSWLGGAGHVVFIGLNPSTADEIDDDPTIRRCIGYAKAWGFAGLCMTNIFAFRETSPHAMKLAAEPIGPRNDEILQARVQAADLVVAAWGTHGAHLDRGIAVRDALPPKLHCLALTKEGHPGHPLYLSKALTPTPWKVG